MILYIYVNNQSAIITMKTDSKLQNIRAAMKGQDWDKALKIAAGFQRLDEYKEAIQLASESITNPAFYTSLGYDLQQIREAGITAIKKRFSKSWEEAQKDIDGA